ncbi:MAG: DUF4179 domain-containing protein [Oscillospiraceae bacterium]|nr:DUF4179 domain-containing protein [Oscillospiraceae bacterium]
MKRKVSDLLDDIQVTDVEIEYSAPLSSRRIEELTMNKITNQERKHRHIGFRLLVAAAVIAALALTTVAAYNYGGWFQNFFAAKNDDYLSEGQLTVLEESIVEINQSVTEGGYTLALESVFGDGTNTYLKFSLTAPEGTVLNNDYYYFDMMYGDIPQEESSEGEISSTSMGFDIIEDDNLTDNIVPMLLRVQGSHINMKDPDSPWKLVFMNLTTRVNLGTPDEGKEIIAEGKWTFEFTLPADAAVLEELNLLTEPVTIQAQTYLESSTVPDKTVEVSMTSFTLRSLSASCTYEYSEGLKVDPVNVVLKDGTVITAQFSSASMDPSTATVQHTFRFETPVSLDQVDYVEFPGGVKVVAN